MFFAFAFAPGLLSISKPLLSFRFLLGPLFFAVSSPLLPLKSKHVLLNPKTACFLSPVLSACYPFGPHPPLFFFLLSARILT